MPVQWGLDQRRRRIRQRHAAPVLLLLFACVSTSATGHAQTSEKVTARLEWQRAAGGESCIDGAGLKRAVETRYERTVFDEGSSDIVVEGKIGPATELPARRTDTWVATLTLSTPDGTPLGSRSLTTRAKDCSALDDSLALALGLMLDMSKAELREAREEPVAPPDQEEPPIRIPEDTYAPRQPWHWGASAAVIAGGGLVPGLGWGGRAGITLEPPHLWKLDLSVALWSPTSAASAAGTSDFSLWTVALAVCPISIGSETELDACVIQRAGIVESTGRHFDRNHEERDSLLNVGLAGRLTVPIAGPLTARLGLSAEAPLLRYRFVYLNEQGRPQQLYRTWPVVLLGYAGAGLRF